MKMSKKANRKTTATLLIAEDLSLKRPFIVWYRYIGYCKKMRIYATCALAAKRTAENNYHVYVTEVSC